MARRSALRDSDCRTWRRAAICAVAALPLCAPSVTLAQDDNATEGTEQRLNLARANASRAAVEADASLRTLREWQQRYEAGTASFTEFGQARLAYFDANSRLKFAQLDVEEIAAGGGPVRTEISAPRIDGRDFVSERLQIDLDSMSVRASEIEVDIKFTEARINAGVATPLSLPPLTTERARFAAEAERIRETLALRQSILDGTVDVATADIRLRLLGATARRKAAEVEVAELRDASGPLQERYAAGVARHDEVLALQTDLSRAEVEVQMAGSEIESLEREIAR